MPAGLGPGGFVPGGQLPGGVVPGGPPGLVTGTVLGPGGRPLAGVCVTASGPAGATSAMTSGEGRYLLGGLAAGTYQLGYHDCAHPSDVLFPQPAGAGGSTGSTGSAGAGIAGLPRGVVLPGGVGLPAGDSAGTVGGEGNRVLVADGQVTRLAAVTLSSPGRPRVIRAEPARLSSLASLRRGIPRQDLGGIAGRVTSTSGAPVSQVCADVHVRNGYFGVQVGPDGRYRLARMIPPGRYTVQFTPYCGLVPLGNWAPQWYRDKLTQSAADPVVVRAGAVTPGIGAVLRRGGQIGGLVRTPSGARASGVCVDVLTDNASTFVAQVTTQRGAYRVRGLDPGRYQVLFDPACGYHRTPYLAQWWPAGATPRQASPVVVRYAAVTAHVDATLRLGGKIAGVVRFRDRSGRPLHGMCVFAQGPVEADASTSSDGSYLIEGLPAGRYSLSFGPGCGDNGNLLYQNYPHAVSVTPGRTRTVDAYLQPGAILSGTVTSAATGRPLGGICVGIGALGDFTRTRADGTYTLDQIIPGRYAVGFDGGCGNGGSYAPQWYPGQDQFAQAERVTFTAGKVTSGIDAAMKPGATISGTVASASGHPLSHVCAGAYDPGLALAVGDFRDGLGGYPSRQGSYQIANLAAGQYEMVFFWCGIGPGFVTKWWPSAPTAATGALIDIPAAGTVSGISAVLRPGGGISGTVDDAAGDPLQAPCVTVLGLTPGSTRSEEFLAFGGGYQLTGLAPGSYDVRFSDCAGQGYASQWYRGQASRGAANPVTVRVRRITAGINAALAKGTGSISGQVTERATGGPAVGACVFAFSGGSWRSARVGPTGRYLLSKLAVGSYWLTFYSCRGGRYASWVRPERVRVSSAGRVAGIDAALAPGASISGTVTGGSPVVAQPGTCVDVLSVDGGTADAWVITGRGGRYVAEGLPAGKYQVRFGDPVCPDGPQGFAPQWYEGARTRSAAATITVGTGAVVTGIDAALLPDGSVSGTVTGPASSPAALSGICVAAVPVSRGRVVYAASDAGSYSLTGLRPGRYRVEFRSGCGTSGYQAQWWDGAGSASGATLVTVRPGAVITGIDAVLRSAG